VYVTVLRFAGKLSDTGAKKKRRKNRQRCRKWVGTLSQVLLRGRGKGSGEGDDPQTSVHATLEKSLGNLPSPREHMFFVLYGATSTSVRDWGICINKGEEVREDRTGILFPFLICVLSRSGVAAQPACLVSLLSIFSPWQTATKVVKSSVETHEWSSYREDNTIKKTSSEVSGRKKKTKKKRR
jgi:hypothetical protein